MNVFNECNTILLHFRRLSIKQLPFLNTTEERPAKPCKRLKVFLAVGKKRRGGKRGRPGRVAQDIYTPRSYRKKIRRPKVRSNEPVFDDAGSDGTTTCTRDPPSRSWKQWRMSSDGSLSEKRKSLQLQLPMHPDNYWLLSNTFVKHAQVFQIPYLQG